MKHDWAQYYDKVEIMDAQVGEVLNELKASGLEENTIVIYYSDHGGILGRSKRFMYESGLKVPMIVYLPKKYQHLAKEKAGNETDRIVNLMDMGPTLLNILNIEIPANMQGAPFLGNNTSEKEYAYGFRGRMDERFDLVRSVRNKKFRYIRNYMPHRIYGQYIEYLWKAPSMKSWEEAYLKGELNETQSAFWKEKPAEELFEISTDPHNVNNLASDPKYAEILTTMRTEGFRWQKEILDVGFIPEPIIERISADMPMYAYVRKDGFPFDRIMETADLATRRDPTVIDEIILRLDDPNPAVRYWSMVGCVILNEEARKVKNKIKSMTKDEEVAVRIAAAEALYKMGEKQLAIETLIDCAKSEYRMGRTMALNVLDLMGENARAAMPVVEKIASEKLSGLTYDVRAAKRIVEKLN